MINLPKPLRICNRLVMYVPKIDLTTVSKRSFNGKQNFLKEIIILHVMIPKPCEIFLITVSGLFTVDARIATLLHVSLLNYNNSLLHSNFLFPRPSDRYCQIYELTEYLIRIPVAVQLLCAVTAFLLQ